MSKNELTIIQHLESADIKKQIASVLPKAITPERMLRLCINCITSKPRLQECNPYSVLGAFMTAASLGLEPNTPLGLAHLVPYNRNVVDGKDKNGKDVWKKVTDCNFIIGVSGFINLAYRSPKVGIISAETSRAGDFLDYQKGTHTYIAHKKALKGRGDVEAAFSHVRMISGFDDFTILNWDDLQKIRSRSETYKALVAAVDFAGNQKDKQKAESKLAETPWVLWEDEMCSKSAIRRQLKRLQLNRELDYAAAIDGLSEVGKLDLKSVLEIGDRDKVLETLAESAIDTEEVQGSVDSGSHKPQAIPQMVPVGAMPQQYATTARTSPAPKYEPMEHIPHPVKLHERPEYQPVAAQNSNFGF